MRILSPQRLPFRHPGMSSVSLIVPKPFLFPLDHALLWRLLIEHQLTVYPNLARELVVTAG